LKTCEYILYDAKPIGRGKDRSWPKCGMPATHLWIPRQKPWQDSIEPMPVCQYHGEGLAGNFHDELVRITAEAMI